jgi:hypothetical protein
VTRLLDGRHHLGRFTTEQDAYRSDCAAATGSALDQRIDRLAVKGHVVVSSCDDSFKAVERCGDEAEDVVGSWARRYGWQKSASESWSVGLGCTQVPVLSSRTTIAAARQ